MAPAIRHNEGSPRSGEPISLSCVSEVYAGQQQLSLPAQWNGKDDFLAVYYHRLTGRHNHGVTI